MQQPFRGLNLIIIAALFQLSCREELDYRIQLPNSEDLASQKGPNIRIYLPSRDTLEAGQETVINAIDAYLLRLKPEGEKCRDQRTIEELGDFIDGKLIEVETYRKCDYLIELMIGEKKAHNPLNLSSTYVNFQDHIVPILSSHCVRCHTDYDSYQSLQPIFEDLVFQVENKLMPIEESLPDDKIATFLAWRSNGYPELDPTSPSDDQLESKLNIFYRNNLSVVIYSYLLLTVKYFNYVDSLWLQEEGTNRGIQTTEWPTLNGSEISQEER